jgi:catechol 2,3-dioxygenase-like lactoylglutathione lyase family enzyme
MHVMIRVLDEARTKDFYERAFGFKEHRRMDFDTFSLVFIKSDQSDVEIELTINKGTEETYTQGTGYGHIGKMNNFQSIHGWKVFPFLHSEHDVRVLTCLVF